jgi:hypothetical protein
MSMRIRIIIADKKMGRVSEPQSFLPLDVKIKIIATIQKRIDRMQGEMIFNQFDFIAK